MGSGCRCMERMNVTEGSGYRRRERIGAEDDLDAAARREWMGSTG